MEKRRYGKPMMLRIPQDVFQAIEQAAPEEHRTTNNMVVHILCLWLEQQENRDGNVHED